MPNYADIVSLVEELSSRRDPYNHHSQRVADLAERLGQCMSLSGVEIDMLKIGAHLHDLGKLLPPFDELLNMPRRLSKSEYSIVKQHAVEGFKMARTLGYHPIIQDIILHHHENWDGTGYPDRLQGQTVSLQARIVHVVDAFAAMNSTRSYRKALSVENARVQIELHSGSMFDPTLVDILFRQVIRP